jgi:hypothetical protein
LTNILITLRKIERDSKKIKINYFTKISHFLKCLKWAHSAGIHVTHIFGMHLAKFYFTRRKKGFGGEFLDGPDYKYVSIFMYISYMYSVQLTQIWREQKALRSTVPITRERFSRNFLAGLAENSLAGPSHREQRNPLVSHG